MRLAEEIVCQVIVPFAFTFYLGRLSGKVDRSRFRIRLTADEVDGGFVAEVFEKPWCMSQGPTLPDALRSVADALEEILEDEAER
jgi:predicted RNase H-like HicB family nuclease